MPTYTGFTKGSGTVRVTEREMARMFYAAGAHGSVFRTQDFAVTPIGGSRRVTVALGTLAVCGVLIMRDTAADIALLDVPQPPAGKSQWNLLVARTNWFTREMTFEWIAGPFDGPLTAATMPTRAPAALPVALQRDPGVIFDVPLAWVWSSFDFTALRIFTLRKLPNGLPVQLADGKLSRTFKRGGNDSWGAGTWGSMVSGTFKDAPAGSYIVSAKAQVSTVNFSIAYMRPITDGVNIGDFRNDFTPQVLPAPADWVVDWPGGDLRVALEAKCEQQPGTVQGNGTQLILTYTG